MATFVGTDADENIYPGYISATVTADPIGSFPSSSNDFVFSGGGDDYVYTSSGDDYVFAGSGDDTVDGGSNKDLIYGSFGNDFLIGGLGDDTLYGGEGNDTLDGDIDANALYGEEGDDHIYVSYSGPAYQGGPDTIVGGSGTDTLYSINVFEDYTVNLATGLTSRPGESITEMENLIAGYGDDFLTGTDGANLIDGGSGDDTIDGGAGADSMYGGDGNDIYYVDNPLDTWTETDDFWSGDADLVIANVDVLELRANVENLTLTGTAVIGGGNGSDNLITGHDGANQLQGFVGEDTLHGMNGNDTLIGGDGGDTLIGGLGNDTFVFNLPTHSTALDPDWIKSGDGAVAFENPGYGKGDVIDLSNLDADTTQPGNQAFIFGGTGAGHLTLVDQGFDTVIQGNTDGNRWFELVIVIRDGGVLAADYNAADFIL